jgi:hypothetical protein
MQLEFNAKAPRSQAAKWARQILKIMPTGRVIPKWWRQKAEAMSSKSLRLCVFALSTFCLVTVSNLASPFSFVGLV